MKLTETELPGVLTIEPEVHPDARGWLLETWQAERYTQTGLAARFVQDNLTYSGAGVLRGLHYQYPNPQGKLVYVPAGEVYSVAVDIRADSSRFGQWVGLWLSAENARQMYIPPGFAHGFCVTGPHALVAWRCTALRDAATARRLRYDDPQLAIRWPVAAPVLSALDADALPLAELPADALPR